MKFFRWESRNYKWGLRFEWRWYWDRRGLFVLEIMVVDGEHGYTEVIHFQILGLDFVVWYR